MQLGMIGLGRMGASMVRRLLRDGHACVVHDVQPSAVAGLVEDGATGAASLKAMASRTEIAEVWRRGSVIGFWLLDLSATALLKDPDLAGYGGRVSDSGEGRWTIPAAIDEGVLVPVLSAALFERFTSRGNADFANRVLSAMRYEFGGHAEKPTS